MFCVRALECYESRACRLRSMIKWPMLNVLVDVDCRALVDKSTTPSLHVITRTCEPCFQDPGGQGDQGIFSVKVPFRLPHPSKHSKNETNEKPAMQEPSFEGPESQGSLGSLSGKFFNQRILPHPPF